MMSKTSCPSSTWMPRETSMPRTGARRLPKNSKCILTAINSTPTTSKRSNYTDTTQVDPPEHLTWNNEDPLEGHVPYY